MKKYTIKWLEEGKVIKVNATTLRKAFNKARKKLLISPIINHTLRLIKIQNKEDEESN